MVHVNSLRSERDSTHIFRVLLSFISLSLQSKGRSFLHLEWTLIALRHLPQQQDGINCACISGHNLMLRDTIDMNHQFLIEFRYWIALQILRGNGGRLCHSNEIEQGRNNRAFKIKLYKIQINENVPGYSKDCTFYESLNAIIQGRLTSETKQQSRTHVSHGVIRSQESIPHVKESFPAQKTPEEPSKAERTFQQKEDIHPNSAKEKPRKSKEPVVLPKSFLLLRESLKKSVKSN